MDKVLLSGWLELHAYPYGGEVGVGEGIVSESLIM